MSSSLLQITSIAAALLGAKHVICTDGCSKVVQLARDNIARAAKELEQPSPTETASKDDNNSHVESSSSSWIHGCRLDVQELWWGRDVVQFATDQTTADLVLVADCVLPKLYPIAPLVQAIDELLVQPCAMALLSYEHRYYPEYDPRDKFRELAEERGLDVEVVPMEQQHPVYSVDDIEIWRVTRRQGC